MAKKLLAGPPTSLVNHVRLVDNSLIFVRPVMETVREIAAVKTTVATAVLSGE